jgi:hypothetical protein
MALQCRNTPVLMWLGCGNYDLGHKVAVGVVELLDETYGVSD